MLGAGDLAKVNLGLKPEVYARLAAEVDTIVHNGALVNHAFSYRQLFEPNVLGTVEVMKLAIATRIKALTFVSSVGVAGGLQHPGGRHRGGGGHQAVHRAPGRQRLRAGVRPCPSWHVLARCALPSRFAGVDGRVGPAPRQAKRCGLLRLFVRLGWVLCGSLGTAGAH